MKTMMSHSKKDYSGIIKAVILMGFSAFYTYTLVSGTVRQYVHPRIDPYLVFSAVVMWLIAGLYIVEAVSQKSSRIHFTKPKYRAFLFYVIPLVMAFVFQPRSGEVNNLTLTAGIGESTVAEENQTNPVMDTIKEDLKPEESGIELRDGVIVMDDDHFYDDMNEIYAHPEKYVGLPIEVVGAVYKDESQFGKDEFVPSRNLMTCCAADTVSIGLLCRYEKTEELASGSWVKVKGIIEISDFNGERMPIIRVQSLETTDKPIDEFIYPY